jgi:N-acetylmuramoyl-L-alanine amidase
MTRYKTLRRIQRFWALTGFIAFASITLVLARLAGLNIPIVNFFIPQGYVAAAFERTVVLISGHAGFDSGAVCTDASGNVLLTEAEINAQVTNLVAERLRRAGANVLILDEYDKRLEGMRATVLLSLHVDSCIEASGYKATHHSESPIQAIEDRLVACIDQYYAAVTGLTRHAATITHNMTNYHAFNRIHPQTPAAILELGFLGGDRDLLQQRPYQVAQGVSDSLLCFLQQESDANHATQTDPP